MPKKKSEPAFDKVSVYQLQAELCGALAHPVRLQILDILADGEKTSSDLLKVLEIPKANLSQHLAVLRDAGIIRARKEGLFQMLSLGIPRIKDACAIVRTVLVEKIAQQEKANSSLIRELRSQKG